MIKRTREDLRPYEMPGHFKMMAMKIHGKEETGSEQFRVSLLTALPGGGAEYAYEKSPLEKFYYVLEGEITVVDKTGNELVVGAGQSVSIMPYEGRALLNTSNKQTVMLVVSSYLS